MTATVRRSGSKAYFGALIVAQMSALIRYVVLARLLGPEQVGLAAIIVVTAQFFDSITDSGSDRFLVQDREGDSPAALRLVQSVALAKGALIAVLLLTLASPIARFVGAPEVAGALQVLAIVPVLTAFTNYDFRLAQRHHRFMPEGKVLFFSEVTGLAATVVAALVVRDFTAILYGLAARAAAAVACSHLIASHRYAVGFSSDLAARLWRFGAPLLLNGFLLFVGSQSDRIIVSRWLGLDELGRYSVLLLAVLYPASMIFRYLSAVFLPRIAGERDRPDRRLAVTDQLESAALLLALGTAVGFALVAPVAIPLIFGPGFAHEEVVIVLVGALLALRLQKVTPVNVALAIGRTGIVLTDNVVRVLAVPLAIGGVLWSGSLVGVVAGLVVAELIANSTIILLVNRYAGWQRGRGFDRMLLFVGVVAALLAYAVAAEEQLETLRWIALGLAGMLTLLALRRESRTVKESALMFRRAVRL